MARAQTADAFLDTGIFVAWMVASDDAHEGAVALFESPPRRLATSLAVVSETYGYFLHRFGEDAARTFRHALAALPNLALYPIDASHHAAVGRKLDRFRGLKLTWVDASSLVFLSEKRIKVVWGTDSDLTIEGARLRPER